MNQMGTQIVNPNPAEGYTSVEVITDEISVTVKDAHGKDKEGKSPVSYLKAKNLEGVLSLLSDKDLKKVSYFIDCLNYGLSGKARTSVRAELVAKLEGPDKAINQNIEKFMKVRQAMGKPVTEAQARKVILAMADMDIEDDAPASDTPAATDQANA